MNSEVELKLSFPPAALRVLQRHPLFTGAARVGRPQTLLNTYYDTPDFALRARRIGLRTRKAGRHWLQTVKAGGSSSAGLSARPEWEQPLGADGFDFSCITDPDVARLLRRHAADIAPIFTTEFRRDTRVIETADSRILLMLDHGEIRADERSEPIAELELELEHGSVDALFDLAIRLAGELPLFPEDRSKAERGFDLFAGTPHQALRPAASAMQAGQNVQAAFIAQAHALLQVWLANARGAHVYDAPEYVHQLRVALRRLRTLLHLFADLLPEDFAARWSVEIGELARSVGSARDLDVLIESVLQPALAQTDEPGAEALLQHARDAADHLREQVRTVLEAPAARVLPLRFARALTELPAPSDEGDLGRHALGALERLHKRVRRRHEEAADLAPESLHSLRIALKRMRYALEFFSPLLPTKATVRYQKQLAAAQDQLGYLNDLAVGRTRLRAWSDSAPELAASAAYVAGWHAPRAAKIRHKILEKVAPLLLPPLPWNK